MYSDSAKAALDDTVEWLKEGGDVAVNCCLLYSAVDVDR